ILSMVLIACAATAASAEAAESPLMGPARQYIDAFNAGNATSASGAFADDAIIVDEVPPYLWRGPDAVRAWAADVAKGSAAYGAGKQRATLGTPTWADMQAEAGYLAVPETVAYEHN